MARYFFAATAVAALLAVASAQYNSYSTAAPVYTTAAPVYTTAAPVYSTAAPVYTTAAPVYTTAAPKCYKAGERCIGAYGYPAVPYLGCCAGLVCEGTRSDWGKSCIKPTAAPTTAAPKCYKAGERCIGAYGYPAVPYLGCCDGLVCEGKMSDWGTSCIKPTAAPTTAAPVYTTAAPTCYKAGQRCMGAYGYPAVPYLGCCSGFVCEGRMSDWGTSCIRPTSAPTTAAPVYTTAAPSYTTAAPKCYKAGQRCMGAYGYPAVPYLGCCSGLVCEGRMSDWGTSCVKPTAAPTTYAPTTYAPATRAPATYAPPTYAPPTYARVYYTAPQCYRRGERCIGAYGYPAVPYLGCCAGLVCEGRRSDWGMSCIRPTAAPTTAAPYRPVYTTAAPRCYTAGQRCMGAYGYPAVPYLGCCAGLVCEGTRADWGRSCIRPTTY